MNTSPRARSADPRRGEAPEVVEPRPAQEEQPVAPKSPMALLESFKYRRLAPMKSVHSQILGETYTPSRFLGRGASASVWEAVSGSKRIAVKVFDQGSKDKKQATRELRVLSRVNHPNIVKAIEVLEGGAFAQLLCEVVDGESLRSFTHRQENHRLPTKMARHFYRQVLDGVHFCHERLVVHRDLKLENLLLDKQAETVKIIDFGFATQVASRDTKLKAFCGTPSYMAPEIVRGEPYSGFAVDVWALGVVVFALLCGTLPFVARTEMQLYAKIRRAIFTPPDSLGELARRLVRGILKNEASTRPTTAAIARHPWVTGLVESQNQEDCDAEKDLSREVPRDQRERRPVEEREAPRRFAPEARRRLSDQEAVRSSSPRLRPSSPLLRQTCGHAQVTSGLASGAAQIRVAAGN